MHHTTHTWQLHTQRSSAGHTHDVAAFDCQSTNRHIVSLSRTAHSQSLHCVYRHHSVTQGTQGTWAGMPCNKPEAVRQNTSSRVLLSPMLGEQCAGNRKPNQPMGQNCMVWSASDWWPGASLLGATHTTHNNTQTVHMVQASGAPHVRNFAAGSVRSSKHHSTAGSARKAKRKTRRTAGPQPGPTGWYPVAYNCMTCTQRSCAGAGMPVSPCRRRQAATQARQACIHINDLTPTAHHCLPAHHTRHHPTAANPPRPVL